MPNWCSTDIEIRHNNEMELKEFYNKLKEWTSHNYCDNGFGLNWLGNVVGNSGIGTIDTGTETDLRCRGSIDYMDLCGNEIKLNTETAWSPMLEMWAELLDKYLPEAEFIYQAFMIDEGAYYTNDPELKDSWLVDYCEEDMYDTMSTDEVVAYLQEVCQEDETDIDKLIEIAEEFSDDLRVYQWEYADVHDFY